MYKIEIDGTDYEVVPEVAALLQAVSEERDEMREALIWCGGCTVFGPGGQAREGWIRIVQPLLELEKQQK